MLDIYSYEIYVGYIPRGQKSTLFNLFAVQCTPLLVEWPKLVNKFFLNSYY